MKIRCPFCEATFESNCQYAGGDKVKPNTCPCGATEEGFGPTADRFFECRDGFVRRKRTMADGDWNDLHHHACCVAGCTGTVLLTFLNGGNMTDRNSKNCHAYCLLCGMMHVPLHDTYNPSKGFPNKVDR